MKLADRLFGDPKSFCHLNREESEKEARRRLYCPASKVLGDVPRSIPSPQTLEERVQRVVNACANVKDAKTGEVFFSKETWKIHNNFIKRIRLGVISDLPGFNYYYTTTNSSGQTTLWCIRGTSQLEGFHRHLRSIFPGFHTSSRLSTLLLALFIFRWNIDRAVERGLLPEDYSNFYQHQLILEIHELRSKSKREGPSRFPEFPHIHDVKDTLERFITPLTLHLGGEAADSTADGDSGLSAGMEFSALRDRSVLPFTPVLACEKKWLGIIFSNFQPATGIHAVSISTVLLILTVLQQVGIRCVQKSWRNHSKTVERCFQRLLYTLSLFSMRCNGGAMRRQQPGSVF